MTSHVRIRQPPLLRYECFDCGTELTAPIRVASCPHCGEEEKFHEMN